MKWRKHLVNSCGRLRALSMNAIRTRMSIQPKQSASSTASLYGMRGRPECF